MCGNPTIFLRNGVITRRQVKEIKGYSMHCIQYKLIWDMMVKRAHRWAYRFEKLRKSNETTH
jgi:hypothetical protein